MEFIEKPHRMTVDIYAGEGEQPEPRQQSRGGGSGSAQKCPPGCGRGKEAGEHLRLLPQLLAVAALHQEVGGRVAAVGAVPGVVRDGLVEVHQEPEPALARHTAGPPPNGRGRQRKCIVPRFLEPAKRGGRFGYKGRLGGVVWTPPPPI